MFPAFLPALGSTTQVSAGNPVCDDAQHLDTAAAAASVRVSFVARLSDSELAEAVNTGVRIEVWTDAPAPGKPEGEWSAVPFEREHRHAEDGAHHVDARLDITAGLHGADAVADEHDVQAEAGAGGHVFRASFRVPQAGERRYSFTYRLVYPSGIQWLGTDHSNGTLEVVAGDNAFFQELEEAAPWVSREGVRTLQIQELDASSGADVRTQIGRLRTDQWRWKGWAIEDENVTSFALSSVPDFVEGRFIYLVSEPTAENGILAPQALVFRTSSRTSSIYIASDGHISVHATGATSLAYKDLDVFEDNSVWLRHSLISSWTTANIIDISQTAVVFSSVDSTQTTAKVHVMPLTTDFPRWTSVPMFAFNALSAPTSSYCAFITDRNEVAVLDIGKGEGVEYIGLVCGSYGGSFTVCSTYGLNVDLSPKWLLASPSLGAPPIFVSRLGDAHNTLPTPPDSPRMRTRHSVSFLIPEETQDNSVSAPPSTGLPPDELNSGSTSARPGPPANALVRRLGNSHILARLRTLFGDGDISHHLFATFAALTGLFTVFMHRLFVFSLVGPPRPRQVDFRPAVADQTSSTPSLPHDPPSSENETSADTIGADEQATAPVSGKTRSASILASSDSPRSNAGPAAPGNGTAPLGAAPVLGGAAQGRRPHSLSFSLEWDVEAGVEPVILIAKCLGEDASLENLLIRMNGKAVRPKATECVGGDAVLLEISRAETTGAPCKLVIGLRG